MEYRNLQEDYRKNKIETNRLSLKLTEMQGELSSRDERCSNLEFQINTLNQRCEVQINIELYNIIFNIYLLLSYIIFYLLDAITYEFRLR